MCGRFRYSDLKEAALRGGLCNFYWTTAGSKDLWDWFTGCVVVALWNMGISLVLRAATDGGWDGCVGATVAMRRRGCVHAAASGEIEAGVVAHAAHKWMRGGERSNS